MRRSNGVMPGNPAQVPVLRRSRCDTPERRSRPKAADAPIGHFDCDDDGSFIEDYGGSPFSIVWKLVDILEWLVSILILAAGIFVWMGMLLVTVSWQFIQWCFTPRGLFVLIPISTLLALLGTWAAMGDYGTAGLAYALLESLGGDLEQLLQHLEISETASASFEKTLAGGILAQRSALDLAAERGYTDALAALLAAGSFSADKGWILGPAGLFGTASPLVAAAEHGHTTAVRILLEAKATESLGWRLGPRGVLGGSSPLWYAARGGHTEILELLLARNVSVETGWNFGWQGIVGSGTPLREASFQGHVSATKLLLEARALPDVGTRLGPLGSLWSDTPLLGAAWNGHVEMVDAFLGAGTSLELMQGEELRRAAFLGHLAVVRRLLDAGARPDAEGRALQAAVRNGHPDIAALLQGAPSARSK